MTSLIAGEHGKAMTRFRDQLESWRSRNPDEGEVWGPTPPWEGNPGLSDVCFGFARSFATWFKVELRSAMESLESPIETMMMLGLLWHAANEQCVVRFRRYGRFMGGGSSGCECGLTLLPQFELGNYRVDFLLEIEEPDLRSLRLTGEQRADFATLIIECDGHDFHEKTKEQAQRDKERDRMLQSMGHHVFRFTGAEIWRDSCQCGEQAWTHLNRNLKTRREQYWHNKGIHPKQIGG